MEPPPPPKDVAEALQQRLDKYQSATDQAKKEGNSSKARRMGRIVKVSSHAPLAQNNVQTVIAMSIKLRHLSEKKILININSDYNTKNLDIISIICTCRSTLLLV